MNAFGQSTTPTTGLILSNTTTSNNPFLWLVDSNSNTGLFPILEVSGGVSSQTLGVEVTSQAVSPAGTAPTLSTIMGTGFGGLSLVQMGAAGTNGPGVASPAFAMCSNQYGTLLGTPGSQGPDCWYWQVQGGAASNPNPPDILELFRQTTTNNSTNLTVLFPAQINLATAAFPSLTTPMAGQITVGPMPYGGINANVPATFTGASTSSALMNAAAGPAMIQPGQLTAGTPDPSATEGALWLMQSYLGTNNVGLLACQDTTAPQGVVVCGNGATSTAVQIIGVFDSNPSQAGATVTPIRYGRAGIKSSSTAQWIAARYVCIDPTTMGQVVANGTTPCNRGTYVGMSVGDTASGSHTHQVDLVQEPIVQGGALMTFFCASSFGSSGVYLFPSDTSTLCNSTSGTVVMQPSSFSGTIKNLEVTYSQGPGGTITDNIYIYTCPSLGTCVGPSSVTCHITGSATSCSDTTDTVKVSLGDGIRILDSIGTGSAGKDVRATILIQ